MADNADTSYTSPYRDFDEGTDNVPPIKFKVRDREYELPGDMPAGPILMGMKQGINMADDSAEMVKFLEMLIGPDNLQQMVADGMSTKQLNELTRWLSSHYGFDVTDEEGEGGKALPRHVRRQKKSSKNGASSGRTSGGSTKSAALSY